jgi:peptide/nickel transport system ATP-binding protein
LIEVKDLTVKFQLTSDELVAAKDICFSLKRGETLGLVGESGSGKSVTALALMRLLPSPPACISGNSVRFDGREMLSSSAEELRRLRGNRVAYVFQDPLTSLNPMFTAGEQIAEVIRLHRDCTRREAWEEAVRLLDSLKIPDARKRAESYPHELSGGMRQRVGLAMALANRPDLLIADEPTTALDVTVQRVVIDLLREQIRDSGTALLFISHDLALVSEVCERVMVMKDGEIVEQGRTREVLSRPQQDYTRKLLDALPSAERAPELSDEEDVETLFELRQVGREFGGSGGGWFSGSRETVRALEDVSFAVPKGSTFGVVGESGCGKTTLARILCGLLPPSSGEVLFEGKQVSDWMNRVGEYRRRVQIVFQDPASSLNPRLRVRSILRQPLQRLADVHDADEQEAEMKKLLKQTGLKEDALDRFPHEFSGGQAQRIGIARALAARPAVLVLDEAVSSLDVSVQAQILDLLRGLRAEGGLTIVFVSHDLAVIRELCTHVAVLSGGRLVECGRAADIFDSPKEEYTQKLLASRVELAHGR